MRDAAADNLEHAPAGSDARVLRVVGARRRFGERNALDGVDLELGTGEIYGLLGPNGAGKTTLIRAISGRLRLDAGRVDVCGLDPAADRDARRRLGLVPQEIALYGDLTARENLTVFGRLMGLGRSDCRRAADRLLDTIGLADRADDLVTSLSGGMKRRLNVAAGVIHRPRLLLLDEPTVGVDPTARENIHELLLELRHDGLAMVLTTHDLEQATELADRVGILIDGRIRAEGRVDDLIADSFGGGRELIVALQEPAPEATISALEDAGLRSSRDRRIWTGRVDRGREDLSSLAADLESTGLRVDEVRVREPGLRGVFFRLAGRDIDA